LKKLIITLIISLNLSLSLKAIDHPEVFPGVTKINDGLYVGKVEDEFYMAMERIYDDNIDGWLEYANAQIEKRMCAKDLKYLPTVDGSSHFRMTLDFYKRGIITRENELWVAYASRDPVRSKANLKDLKYISSIEMFVTVVTSQDALITSHMGISRTFEAALDLQQAPPKHRKHPNQSIHLHSFAAKVITIRDPRKVYMLTSPVPIMLEILLKNMPPDSVFVGDNIYQKKLEDKEKETDEPPFKKRKISKNLLEAYRKQTLLLRTNPPRIIINDDELTILNPDRTFLTTFNISTSQIYQWLNTEPYSVSKFFVEFPYVLVDLDKLAHVYTLEY
jgi:hypothetical protein